MSERPDEHEEYDDFDYDGDYTAEDAEDEADANCMGWFEEGSGRFVCGSVGSEDCDCCPNYFMLGMTHEEAMEAENERICEILRHEEWLKLRKFAP